MDHTPDLDGKLTLARGGDEAALMDLLEHFGPQVRERISHKLTGALRTSLDEDDVMQVTYLEACLRLENFTTGGAKEFGSWLSRLAENNLIDAIRAMESAKRPNPNRRVSNTPRHDSMSALVELLGVTHTTPSLNVAKGEASAFLDRAISQLPPDYEMVVRMYDLNGRSIQEVSEELKRSEGAIFMLRARAHDRLKEILGSGSRFFSMPG